MSDRMRYFAVSDNRTVKARKIEAVLCDALASEGIRDRRILDLGCGSGHIAEYFSRANEVVAADVIRQMRVPESGSLKFRRVDAAELPFEDGCFDIVLYNHVFFCSGDQAGQLKEIYRVLKEDGVCYFASANRYFPIEGFTRLPLLHYLPHRLFQRLSRRIRKTDEALFPAGYHRMLGLIGEAGFALREYTGEIIRHPQSYQSEYSFPFLRLVPNCLSPTVVFVLRKRAGGG